METTAAEPLLHAYLEQNRKARNPIVFFLTNRGFFSEVNNALNAMLYALVHRRRIVFDQSRFMGFSWTDFFLSDLPGFQGDRITPRPRWLLIQGVATPHFTTIRIDLQARWQAREIIDVPELGLSGTVFDFRRLLAAMLCRPRVSSVPGDVGLVGRGFASLHVRRGDKLEAVGARGAQGEDISPATYLALMREHGVSADALHLLTDDYSALHQFRRLFPHATIVSQCGESETGYRHAEFLSKPLEERRRLLRRLISEVQIASQAAGFLGPFKSNVSAFIPTISQRPDRCFGVDAWREWTPL